MEEYGKHMERIVRTLFCSLASDLKLDPSLLDSCMDPSNGILRLYRYPRLPQAQSFLGMEAHTDSSVLTVVDQDDVGGLQILDGGAWFHVKPVANTLIVHIGDMFQVSLPFMYSYISWMSSDDDDDDGDGLGYQ